MKYLLLIAILSLFCFGCVTTDQPSPSPQDAKQTSDTIGPLRAEPVNVSVPVANHNRLLAEVAAGAAERPGADSRQQRIERDEHAHC